ncbi:MAG: hypothetical protein N3D16_03215 [Anaerolineales bacterium]|nr:hypothetical protein [Anaerolineales bacterium]
MFCGTISQVYNLSVYTSWFKNKPEPEGEEIVSGTSETPSRSAEELSSQRISNFGTRLFLFMVLISFGFTALVIYLPSIGVPLAFCGFPIAVILLSLWILRALF